MVAYRWSAEKEAALRADRGLEFDALVLAIETGGLLDDIENPSRNFPHQRAYVVAWDGYAVIVPYVRDGDTVFLKTAYRNRKATRRYIGDQS
ncbi:toxin [Roseicyclus persicicus]|uniref:Toxin n=1 Tax=Roseicyclus persicicus TaxID=2650661 RepID=A0A7X6GVE9_9RHOB|nr:toxin [Roseibacterium persicicum]NKX43089.1 toxin [Roseibacterium persicicum]